MEKTIVEKLNLNKFDAKLVVDLPDESYLTDLESFDQTKKAEKYDLIFVFATDDKEDFAKKFTKFSSNLTENGSYVVAYPKKGNKKFDGFIGRDELFDLLNIDHDSKEIAGTTLKFSRMLALDEIYTVIVIKNQAKKTAKSSAASSRVSDYEAKIPELRQILAENERSLSFFDDLTAGYQRDWARYIYSAKQEKTQEKRINEMFSAFDGAFKTADLYKKSLK